MEEKKINCTLITPLFSFGAYRGIPELRTTELKGAMRYTYRIACPTDSLTLAKDESELFGGANGSAQTDGHASPLRLLIRGTCENKKEDLLLHKTGTDRKILPCFIRGGFEITARFNRSVVDGTNVLWKKADLDWYEDLIKLSLIMCGMGRRSRKGRGCFRIDNPVFENRQQVLGWVCRGLNKIAAASSKEITEGFRLNDREILPSFSIYPLKRPIIQKIKIGKRIEPGETNGYLWAVDETCHLLKDGKLGLPYDLTGGGKGKFASPLFIRIIETEEGCYPLYIFVKGIHKNRDVDRDCSGRERIILEIEKRQRKGVRS